MYNFLCKVFIEYKTLPILKGMKLNFDISRVKAYHFSLIGPNNVQAGLNSGVILNRWHLVQIVLVDILESDATW